MTGHAAAVAALDADPAEWPRVLAGSGPQREAALAQLHALLLRIARGEVARRGPRLQLTGPELDDLAYQAAADALIAITSKLAQFRGESRFTTWACKFVIFTDSGTKSPSPDKPRRRTPRMRDLTRWQSPRAHPPGTIRSLTAPLLTDFSRPDERAPAAPEPGAQWVHAGERKDSVKP